MDAIHKKISREDAINSNPDEYQRGYYDGYHKAYADKLKAVNKAKKDVAEEYKLKLASKEIYGMYPFNMIYDIVDPGERCMLSAELVEKVIAETLSDRDRRCLEMRYREDMTLEQCGQALNVTRERVRQICARAQRKLRNPSVVKRMKVIPFNEYVELQKKATNLEIEIDNLKMQMPENSITEKDAIKEWMDKDIGFLELSIRAYNCLKRAGYNTIGDVSKTSYTGLCRIRNMGRKSAEEIANKMKDIGIDIA